MRLSPGGRWRMTRGVVPQPMPFTVTRAPAGSVVTTSPVGALGVTAGGAALVVAARVRVLSRTLSDETAVEAMPGAWALVGASSGNGACDRREPRVPLVSATASVANHRPEMTPKTYAPRTTAPITTAADGI